MVRGFEKIIGRGEAALAYYKKHLKIHPLGDEIRRRMLSVHRSKKVTCDTPHPRDIRYFELLNKMVQYEPISSFTHEELGFAQGIRDRERS